VVRIWDPSTGTRISEFGGDAGRTNTVASHGGWLATAVEEGRVEIWALSTGTRWAELTGHTGRVNAVAVSPSGTWPATAGEDRTLRIWDLAAGACVAVMPVERPLRCCAWGAGDRHVVAGGLAGLYRFAVDRPA
jgi:WD40 repeat protein